jgi:hypothetical protein
MGDADLFVQNGTESEHVTSYQNVTAAPDPSTIVEISPDRGLFLHIENGVPQGENPGVPLYMDLRDSNDDPLPASTSGYFRLKLPDEAEGNKVSRRIATIQHWNANSITQQRDVDNVDASKVVFQGPGGASVPAIEVRDNDQLQFVIDSTAQIDWNNSEWYVDTVATSQSDLQRRG